MLSASSPKSGDGAGVGPSMTSSGAGAIDGPMVGARVGTWAGDGASVGTNTGIGARVGTWTGVGARVGAWIGLGVGVGMVGVGAGDTGWVGLGLGAPTGPWAIVDPTRTTMRVRAEMIREIAIDVDSLARMGWKQGILITRYLFDCFGLEEFGEKLARFKGKLMEKRNHTYA